MYSSARTSLPLALLLVSACVGSVVPEHSIEPATSVSYTPGVLPAAQPPVVLPPDDEEPAPIGTGTDWGGYRPHYQGFGAATRGGRGGDILRVTSLADAGPGSLRAALATCAPRLVVFEVSGRITLSSPLYIRCPYVTVAGQTAPSPGIMVTNGSVYVDTHDVVLQHFRIRQGIFGSGGEGAALYLRNSIRNVVLDHMSVSWSQTSTVVVHNFPAAEFGEDWYSYDTTPASEVAFLDSIFSEGLANYQATPPHGSVGTIFYGNGDGKTTTLARNFFAHNGNRNPWLTPGWSASVYNNVVYDPAGVSGDIGYVGFMQLVGAGYGWNAPIRVAYVNNVNLAGPQTHPDTRTIKVSMSAAQKTAGGWQLYLAGNVGPHMTLANQWSGLTYCTLAGISSESVASENDLRVDTPPAWHTTFQHAVIPTGEVFASVLANVGARPRDRDVVDARVLQEAVLGTGRHLTSQNEVGGFPLLPEKRRTLTLPAAHSAVAPGQGFRTNAEVWLERCARELEVGGDYSCTQNSGAL